MITELISVGTEILLGNIVNTNSAYLSEKCALLGLSVYYQDVVGDNEGRMRDVIRTALDRSDVVILTGGLGPTEDDITKEVTADLMGMPLVEDSHSKKLIDKYLKEYEKNNPQYIMLLTGFLLYVFYRCRNQNCRIRLIDSSRSRRLRLQ